MKAILNGKTIAESADIVENDGYIYFPPGAVRMEELLEQFTYDEPLAFKSHPISASIEIAEAPWQPKHRLVWIRVDGKREDAASVLAQPSLNATPDDSSANTAPASTADS